MEIKNVTVTSVSVDELFIKINEDIEVASAKLSKFITAYQSLIHAQFNVLADKPTVQTYDALNTLTEDLAVVIAAYNKLLEIGCATGKIIEDNKRKNKEN